MLGKCQAPRDLRMLGWPGGEGLGESWGPHCWWSPAVATLKTGSVPNPAETGWLPSSLIGLQGRACPDVASHGLTHYRPRSHTLEAQVSPEAAGAGPSAASFRT